MKGTYVDRVLPKTLIIVSCIRLNFFSCGTARFSFLALSVGSALSCQTSFWYQGKGSKNSGYKDHFIVENLKLIRSSILRTSCS